MKGWRGVQVNESGHLHFDVVGDCGLGDASKR